MANDPMGEKAICHECGERCVFDMGNWKLWCPNTGCPSNKAVPPSADVVVALRTGPTREQVMADSRCARWQPIETVPDDRPVLITRKAPHAEVIYEAWLLRRARYNGRTLYINGIPATHWCEDILGTPAS